MAYDVSVIVPIYNMAEHVEKGINMLKAQTCARMQVVLVNDGSTDGSEQAIRRAIEGLPDYTLITTPNQGSGPARNTGIVNALGKYLYFFDIDDRLDPHAIERMVALAEDAQCDLLVFSFDRTKDFSVPALPKLNADVSADGDEIRAHFDRYMDYPTNVTGAPWNKLFRRDVTLDNGVVFPPLRRHQDEGFLMRYMAVARKVRFSDEILYHHLLNNTSRMWQKYPRDYDVAIEGLMDMYESIIIPWDPQNNAVRLNVYRVYYIRSLDFLKTLFNRKWKYSPVERYRRLVARQKVFEARSAKYADLDFPHDRYWNLIQGKHYFSLYCALYSRILRNRLTGA